MDSSLFFLFIFITIVAYGVQTPFNIYFSRKTDPFTLTTYRGLSLAITMAPLLWFAGAAEIAKILDFIPTLLIASSVGPIGFMFNLAAAHHLPMGISNSVRQAVYTLSAMALGLLFFNELLSLWQFVFLLLIVSGVVALALTRGDTKIDTDAKPILGVLYGVLAGISYAISFMLYSELARNMSPLVAGYFWEALIGIFALLLWIGRRVVLKTPMLFLNTKDTLLVGLVSLTTIAATISYGFAVNYGHYALAAGLVQTNIVITAIAGWLVFKEKLSYRQIVLILFILACIMVIKFIS